MLGEGMIMEQGNGPQDMFDDGTGGSPAPPSGDQAGSGYAGIPLYDFAQGVVQIQQTTADMQTASGGHGYRFDPDSAQAVIDEINAVLDEELVDARDDAQSLIQISPPGDESVSKNYVAIANASGQSYNNYLNSTFTYLERWRDALIEARKTYLEQEDHVADGMKRKNT